MLQGNILQALKIRKLTIFKKDVSRRVLYLKNYRLVSVFRELIFIFKVWLKPGHFFQPGHFFLPIKLLSKIDFREYVDTVTMSFSKEIHVALVRTIGD